MAHIAILALRLEICNNYVSESMVVNVWGKTISTKKK